MERDQVERQRRRRRNILVLAGIVVAVIVGFAALVGWDLGRECARWSTRIDVHDNAAVSYTRVCAEFKPIWPRPEE